MWCRRWETSASRAKVFSTVCPSARPDLPTAAAEKVEEPRLTMTPTLTEGRNSVQLTYQREETNDLSTQAMGGKPPTYNQTREEADANPPKEGRSRGETD